MARPLLAPALAALVLASAGCGRSPPEATPQGAARELVELATNFDGRPADAEAIFRLLSERAKQNLRARANRYGAASGRQISAAAMIVPSRVVPSFEPRTYTAHVSGEQALVEIQGVQPSERAELACLREQGLWHVDLSLPDLPPMRVRPGATP